MKNPALYKRFLITTFALFLIFLTSTFLAWLITKDVAESELRSIFSEQSRIIEASIENRLNLYTTVLYGIKGFFEGSQQVTMDEWSRYINILELKDRYPGINSSAFAQKVEENGNARFIVKHVDPIERSAALGFDITSESTRLQAVNRAIEKENISITDRILLTADKKPGFLMLIPIYENGDKSNIEGFAILTFNTQLVFKNVYGKDDPFPNLNFRLYREDDRRDESLLYQHNPGQSRSENDYKPKFKTSSSIKLNGETLFLDISTGPGFSLSPAAERLPTIVLISGLLFSSLFTSVFLYRLRHLISANKQKPIRPEKNL